MFCHRIRNFILLVGCSALLLIGGNSISALSGCQNFFGYKSLTLEFPETVSLGELSIIEDVNCFTCGNGRQFLGEAKGQHKINLPYRWFISLKMPSNASTLMPYLRHPSLASIGDVQLQESDIKDDDLKYLMGINLRSLDLSKTGITGVGLKYLKPHEKWFSIHLYDCKALALKYLAHFKGWERISIGLVPLQMDDRDYSTQQRKLIQDARKIVCGSQSQQNCQVGY